MQCSQCGSQIPDGVSVCPNCGQNPYNAGQNFGQNFGQNANNFVNNANNMFNNAEQQLGSAFNDARNAFNGYGSNAAPNAGEKLQEDRSLIMYILLTIVTCGIYGYYFIYKMAHDVNIACEGDGESTSGLAKFIILSIITCGIYSWIWEYGLANRLASNAHRYGMNFQENGTTVILWLIFGSFICGIGPFIAMNILIKNSNKICYAYNRTHGYM